MVTVLRFAWQGFSLPMVQDQVRPEVSVGKAGPVPAALVDVTLEADEVTEADEDDAKNAMHMLGWLFVEKDPSTL